MLAIVTFAIEVGAAPTVVGVPFDVDAEFRARVSRAHVGVRHFVDQVSHLHLLTLTENQNNLSQMTKLQW